MITFSMGLFSTGLLLTMTKRRSQEDRPDWGPEEGRGRNTSTRIWGEGVQLGNRELVEYSIVTSYVVMVFTHLKQQQTSKERT